MLRPLRKTIASLSSMPFRAREAEVEPWRSRGVRRILLGKFIVYYRIDDQPNTVYVLNVTCARGDRGNAFAKHQR